MDREEVRQRAYKWSRDFTTETERRLAVDLLLLLDELAARDAAIEKLAQFIMDEVPGEPSQSEGAATDVKVEQRCPKCRGTGRGFDWLLRVVPCRKCHGTRFVVLGTATLQAVRDEDVPDGLVAYLTDWNPT